MKNSCPHCDPYIIDKKHINERINRLFEPFFALLNLFDRLMHAIPFLFKITNYITLTLIFHIPKKLKWIKPTKPDKTLFNRTQVIINEAAKRNIHIEPLAFRGRTTHYCAMHLPKKTIYFEGLPHLRLDHQPKHHLDDKKYFKKLLKKNNIPHPIGRTCRTYHQALEFTSQHGFPVIIKPTDGSLSKHTTCNINNESSLKQAVDIAKIISPKFLVEQHIKGDVFRATCVNNKLIAICTREPANIIGDGHNTIQQLIDIKNSHEHRGETHTNNTTLHHIPITQTTHNLLEKQQLKLKSIPQKNTKVYLQTKVTLTAGADIHDITDTIHPDNKQLIEQTAHACNTTVIGIDGICPDITRPYTTQSFAIIEANTLPYIDMHHFPTTGKSHNIAAAIIDHLLPNMLQ